MVTDLFFIFFLNSFIKKEFQLFVGFILFFKLMFFPIETEIFRKISFNY
jgi:hypothetical protein